MLCEDCKKEIAELSAFCNFCGSKVTHNKLSIQKNSVQPSIVTGTKVMSSPFGKKTILVVSSITLLLIISILGYRVLVPYYEYSEAKSLLEDREFEDAINIFTQLENYKDSSELVLESKFKLAEFKIEQQKYIEAIDILKSLGDYNNVATLLENVKFLQSKVYVTAKQYNKSYELLLDMQESKDRNSLLAETRYHLGKQYFDNHEYKNAIDILNQTSPMNEETNNLLIQARYEHAINLYNIGDFSSSKIFFESKPEYKESAKYIEKNNIMLEFVGTWEDKYGFSQKIFNGWSVWSVHFPNHPDTSVYEFDTEQEGNQLSTNYDTYIIKNGKLYENNGDSIYYKKGIGVNVPEEKPSPKIGMTKQEVLDSNWGKPNDINKTTTEYGTSEQWVYDKKGYIYFDDGLVSTIQN